MRSFSSGERPSYIILCPVCNKGTDFYCIEYYNCDRDYCCIYRGVRDVLLHELMNRYTMTHPYLIYDCAVFVGSFSFFYSSQKYSVWSIGV